MKLSIEKNDRKYLCASAWSQSMMTGCKKESTSIQPHRLCNGNCNEHYTLWNKR